MEINYPHSLHKPSLNLFQDYRVLAWLRGARLPGVLFFTGGQYDRSIG
jgi:hypothetical protein